MDNEELSTAVVKFLGFGSAAFPQRDNLALVALFGHDKAGNLEHQVAQLLQEIGEIRFDWKKYTLQSAGEMMRVRIGESHPELNDTALRALEWKFTFDFR